MLTQIWNVTRHNFLSFQVIFCSFATLLTLKIYTCVPLIKIISCMVPEIWSATDRICHLGQLFALLPPPPPPKQPKNENIKNEKKPWRYHDFTQVYQKPWPSAHSVHPPLPLFCCGVWASYQIFKKGGGLTGPLFLEQVAGKEGGDFFQGGLQFFNKK